jgi:protein phosphatase PTC7
LGRSLLIYECRSFETQTQGDEGFGFLKTGVTIIPHPKKEFKGGEDALAIRPKMISVADGVGGWAKKGVDVAKYSKQLMRLIGEAYDSHPELTPNEILAEASSHTTEIGSTTVVIAILDPHNKKLMTTLLGDSSYMLLRPVKENEDKSGAPLGHLKMYRSVEQQHRFNCPYQIGTGKDSPNKA